MGTATKIGSRFKNVCLRFKPDEVFIAEWELWSYLDISLVNKFLMFCLI